MGSLQLLQYDANGVPTNPALKLCGFPVDGKLHTINIRSGPATGELAQHRMFTGNATITCHTSGQSQQTMSVHFDGRSNAPAKRGEQPKPEHSSQLKTVYVDQYLNLYCPEDKIYLLFNSQPFPPSLLQLCVEQKYSRQLFDAVSLHMGVTWRTISPVRTPGSGATSTLRQC